MKINEMRDILRKGFRDIELSLKGRKPQELKGYGMCRPKINVIWDTLPPKLLWGGGGGRCVTAQKTAAKETRFTGMWRFLLFFFCLFVCLFVFCFFLFYLFRKTGKRSASATVSPVTLRCPIVKVKTTCLL